MTSKETILQLVNIYRDYFPSETGRIWLFSDFLSQTDEANLITRKNFNGHITTSAFIIDTDATEMLLLKHKSLNRWLQPGGHVDDGDISLIHSALREAEEETGIPANHLTHLPAHTVIEMPFDIDSHYIPANPKKAEDGHYHHDLRYLFVYQGDKTNRYNPDESTGLKWVPFVELANDDTFSLVARKIRAYLDAR